MPCPEIASGVFLSGNTIKSQASSICHKLGAELSRRAVARARELSLDG